jgi:transcription antitermination factor NusG
MDGFVVGEEVGIQDGLFEGFVVGVEELRFDSKGFGDEIHSSGKSIMLDETIRVNRDAT